MAWKQSEQANMLISTGLPRPGLLALCIMKAQEVTTNPHATTVASPSPQAKSVETTSKRILHIN